MKLLHSTREFTEYADSSVVTIGVYDGVHLGHQAIISECLKESRKRQIVSVVLTFDRNPKQVVRGETPCWITPLDKKVEIIEKLGVDFTVVVEFDDRFASMSSDRFCAVVLADQLKAKKVCVGENFHFGKGGEGNVDVLSSEGALLGFEVDVVPLVEDGEKSVSSTMIRNLIKSGEISKANKALGRPYSVRGRVVVGHSRGKSLGFPTANLMFERKYCTPCDGVYAGASTLGDRRYRSAINVGSNPTFGDEETAVEVFLLDFEKEIYGEFLEVEFHYWLRDEITFKSGHDLAVQLQKDVERVTELMENS